MKANVTFELDQASGRERTRVSLYDADGKLLGDLPCIVGCNVAYQHDGLTRLTLSLLVDRKNLTFGTPKADGEKAS